MITTILFDFDGVIGDSLKNIYRWFNHAASVFNINLPIHSVEEIKEQFLEPFPEFYKYLGFDWDKDQRSIYHEYINYHEANRVNLVEGIEDVIQTLSSNGDYSLGIVSSNEQQLIDRTLEAHGISHYFDIVIGTDKNGTLPFKPDPTTLLTAMRFLGTAPSQTVYIGDQPTDMLTAQNASQTLGTGSITTVAITTGFASRQS